VRLLLELSGHLGRGHSRSVLWLQRSHNLVPMSLRVEVHETQQSGGRILEIVLVRARYRTRARHLPYVEAPARPGEKHQAVGGTALNVQELALDSAHGLGPALTESRLQDARLHAELFEIGSKTLSVNMSGCRGW
jgi:hypothetical protein